MAGPSIPGGECTVYVHPDYVDAAVQPTSVGRAIWAEAEWMAERGIEVHCICGTLEEGDSCCTDKGVHVQRIKASSIPRVRAVVDRMRNSIQARRIGKNRPVLVIAPDREGLLLSKPGSNPLIARIYGSATLDSHHAGNRVARKDGWFERRMLSFADHVQTVSRFAAEETFRVMDIKPKPVTVIPPPVINGVRSKKSRVAEPGRILYVCSRLSEPRGIAALGQALATVLRDIPEARVTMTGGEIQSGGRPAKDILLESIPGDSHQRVEFATAPTPEEMARLTSGAQVLVITSYTETFSYLTLEAMALGCPVVAPARGGLKELIVDEETGFLVEPEAPEAYARAIAAILRNPDRAGLMSECCGKLVERSYSPGAVFEKTLNLHRMVLNNTLGRATAPRNQGLPASR